MVPGGDEEEGRAITVAGTGAIYTGRGSSTAQIRDKGVVYVRREETVVRTERLICVRSLYFVPTRRSAANIRTQATLCPCPSRC